MTQNSTPRYCEVCQRDERCHCPAMKSWCDVCVPPISVQARNTIAKFVAAIDRPAVVIPRDHCWVGSCQGPCKGHKLTTPAVQLVRHA